MPMFRGKARRIHFVGIGGIGMSGIAELLLNLGYEVSGSDLKESEVTRRLAAMGAVVARGHRAEHLGPADVVVVSSAVPPDNPEIAAARAQGIPVIPRAEMLAELMRLKYGVAIAGSHGKTTTTSLVGHLLQAGGLDPTVVVGGKVNTLGSSVRLGQGDYLVAEADESDGSFLVYAPTIAVVTNIDPEHMDHYGSMDALRDAFVRFVNRLPFYGLAVLCLDHPEVQGLIPRIEKRYRTYGFGSQADWQVHDLRYEGMACDFEVVAEGKSRGRFRIPMVGRHNVLNALAALVVADEMGVREDLARRALAEFGGVQRRFTVRGEVDGITVVDDYGHHPAEIRAVLAGARTAFDRRTIAVFQPHRYTRTRDLAEDFATAFNDADAVVVTDIYAAGEAPIEGVSAEALVESIRRHGHRDVAYVARLDEVASAVVPRLERGDLLITFGAGDVWKAGEAILARLRSARGAEAAQIIPGPGRRGA
ncbi:MAG: UDP-N-acetylmuramate--L-alanine ligase [Deltaproteobacteria bacterium]|nr:MAG: UDP-N-acetylmuramate--L-alanine ligase [Deltaproteobacteria bacterium]